MKYSLFLLSILLLLGCATTQSISTADRSKTFDASYKEVFQAIIQTFNDAGFAIQQADTDMGIITTGYKQAGAFEAFLMGDSRAKLNAMVSTKEKSTRVVLTVSAEQRAAFTGWRATNMTETQAKEIYNKYFQMIEERIN